MEGIKKYIAELIGTFVLVLFGCGAAVFGGVGLANGVPGLGLLGVSFAFGLAVVSMAYTVGPVSGGHFNPAVSIAMLVNKRLSVIDFIGYLVFQVVGALAGSAVIYYLLSTQGLPLSNFGQNSFGTLGAAGAFITELILTFVFVLIIVKVTSKQANSQWAGLIIGLSLVLIHILGIPLTGTSVNPARSLAPAIFAGGAALSQVWVFLVAPLVGGVLAALAGRFLLDSEKDAEA
jgi:aquaporin Z